MNSGQVLTLIAALFAGSIASVITGILARPKTRAEAGATAAVGEVAISGDAREWARQFAEQAAAANTRAQAAEDRCDAIEHRLDVAIAYIRQLQREVVAVGGHPPVPPPELIPPLEPVTGT